MQSAANDWNESFLIVAKPTLFTWKGSPPTDELGRRIICTFVNGCSKSGERLNNLASVVQVQRRSEEARPLYQQALGILQATLPADHPNIASLKTNIASLPSPPTEQN
jgi:hypothetical protein